MMVLNNYRCFDVAGIILRTSRAGKEELDSLHEVPVKSLCCWHCCGGWWLEWNIVTVFLL